MEFLTILILGILGWFVTGVDDMIIFTSLYKESKNKILTIGGLFLGVILMIGISLFLGQYAFAFGKISILGAFLPIILSFKIIYDYIQDKYFEGDLTKAENQINFVSAPCANSILNPLYLSFLGYITNAMDDILYNSALIMNKSSSYICIYFLGVFIGAIIMVVLSRKLHTIRDFPLLRAGILFIVGSIIFFNGFQLLFK